MIAIKGRSFYILMAAITRLAIINTNSQNKILFGEGTTPGEEKGSCTVSLRTRTYRASQVRML